MKTTIISILLSVGLFFSASSQEETQYLIGKEASFSGFGGLMGELSLVRDRAIYSMGGGGGVLMNQQFFIGGYGMGNVIDGPLYTYQGVPVSLEMGHGGLWIGYLINPKKVVHFGASSRFGWGGIGLRDDFETLLLSDDIFLISPQLQADINVLPFMKVSLAGGYRTVLGVSNPYFSRTDFNAPFAMLGIYFGWFGGS